MFTPKDTTDNPSPSEPTGNITPRHRSLCGGVGSVRELGYQRKKSFLGVGGQKNFGEGGATTEPQ